MCILYELFISPILKKRTLSRIEKQIREWSNLISGCGVISDEKEKKEVSVLIEIYENTKFEGDDLNLKIEIAKLIFSYVITVSRILNQNGIQATSFSDDDNETVQKLIKLEKDRDNLEYSIKNLLTYINNKEK